jgi:phosphopantothenoylcysteine decarboxylase/phosphopantothenate--cysteine ligase
MHHQMWRNPATVANVATLRSRGILVMEPAEGPLNNGDSGVGRFPETFEILDFLQQSGFLRSDLLGKHVVVTAGGTREMIDPVRFIGNRSSGKQGIALAKAAASRGARVSLIAANVGEDLLPNDQSITLTKVESALQLANTLSKIESFDILLMTAAVADYRPVTASVTKLKRDGNDRSLELIENPDVLAGFARNYRNSGGSGAGIIVGFAAESEVNLISAAEKLARKAVDYLFVNDVSAYPVFDSDSNGGVLLRADGARKDFGYQSKETLSDVLLDELVKGLG